MNEETQQREIRNKIKTASQTKPLLSFLFCFKKIFFVFSTLSYSILSFIDITFFFFIRWVDVLLAPILAILATILIFMDQQITAVIVNRKEHQLKKGGGYHLDLLVLALIIVVCSVFGLPWFVAGNYYIILLI